MNDGQITASPRPIPLAISTSTSASVPLATPIECFGFQPDGSYSMRHLSVGHAEPLRAELMAFVSAIANNTAPAVTGAEGVASLEVAMRCLQGDVTPAQRKPRKVAG